MEKKTDGTTKPEWKKVGQALVYDTKQDGTSRATKHGTKFHMGRGSVTVGGVTLDVMVTVMPGRPGSLNVFIEQPPEDGR